MSIKSIRIINILSFDDVLINDFSDITCIIGKNNVGKSNLLKIIKYFYRELEGERVLPPLLNSNYSNFGKISITFDTTRIKKIVTSKKNNSSFLKHIYNTLFKDSPIKSPFSFVSSSSDTESEYTLDLQINSDNSTSWSSKDKNIRNILAFLYPFFEIETRHIDLHDWNRLWNLITRLKTFSFDNITTNEIVNFINGKISNDDSYKAYIDTISNITNTENYSYQDKILNYVKIGLNGHQFTNNDQELSRQSDGTNSHKYIALFLELLVSLTRKEYISPIVFIDEPELGLHPKRNEELIFNYFELVNSYKKTKNDSEPGKFKTPLPKVIISTHSPNILKDIIRLFQDRQIVVHFSKSPYGNTIATPLKTRYNDNRFLNIFSDNESRLFFSTFILFVEGATEIELFQNLDLLRAFPKLSKIDICHNNNVTHKYLNSSFSKSPTPSLTVYDADVLINADIDKLIFSLKSDLIDLDSIKQKYSKSYFNSNQYKNKKYLNRFLSIENRLFSTTQSKMDFSTIILDFEIQLLNEKILNNEKYYLNHSTIEGVLINKSSLSLVKKWIEHEVLSLFDASKSDKHLQSIIKRFDNNTSPVYDIAKSLLTNEHSTNSHSKIILDKIHKIKKAYIKDIFKTVKKNVEGEFEEAMYYRLFFNGKTNTLLSRNMDSFTKNLPQDFKKDFKDFRTKTMKPLSHLEEKTSGWVSKFLSFSLKELDKNDNFEKEFSSTFKELYDIITLVSSSID
jgi:predicted ATP-dependent endonuclease of OLD family